MGRKPESNGHKGGTQVLERSQNGKAKVPSWRKLVTIVSNNGYNKEAISVRSRRAGNQGITTLGVPEKNCGLRKTR